MPCSYPLLFLEADKKKKIKSFEQRILVRTRNNTDLSEDGMCRQRGGSGCVCYNQMSARLQCRVEYMEYNFPLHLHSIQWLWTTHYLKKKKKSLFIGLSLMVCYSCSTVSSVQNDSVICLSPIAFPSLLHYPA